MRILLIFALSLIPAAGQIPGVRIVNVDRPFSADFQVGDRFEVRITGTPDQPISVRTMRQGRTDWGPVIAMTDSAGRWSTSGRFGKESFGGWAEIWTVGSKLAMPTIQFNVSAPCLLGGRGSVAVSGPNMAMTCETSAGSETFGTPSFTDSFLTPDGRTIPGRSMQQTLEQYRMNVIEGMITGDLDVASLARLGLGDTTVDLIRNLIGVNALSDKELHNVVAIVRAAFEMPETIAPDARTPARTLQFLRKIEQLTDQEDLRPQVAETIAYIQSH